MNAQKIEIIKNGFPVLASYCSEKGITDGRHVDIAFTRLDNTTWRGIRVFKDRVAEGVVMHNRNSLLWWHEAVDVLRTETHCKITS